MAAEPAELANILLTLVYLAIFVIGVVGNLCNCLVIADPRNKLTMRSATNYYLFSLSVSDLLLLIFGLPHDLLNLWHPDSYLFSQFVCISRGWLSEASTYASVLVIVAFTVERYLAICHPLRSYTMSKLSRSVKIIVLIWLLASSCALPVVLQYGLRELSSAPVPVVHCTTVHKNETIFELSTLTFFIIPMALITCLYLRLGCHLRHKARAIKLSRKLKESSLAAKLATHTQLSVLVESPNGPPQTEKPRRNSEPGAHQVSPSMAGALTIGHSEGNHYLDRRQQAREGKDDSASNSSNNNNGTNSHCFSATANHHQAAQLALHSTANTASIQSVIKMLVSVVVMFFVCWAPFHAQRLMAIYVTNPTPEQELIHSLLNHISGISYYISAVANPILYSLFSLKFRQAFRDTFGGRCLGRRHSAAHGTHSYSSNPPV